MQQEYTVVSIEGEFIANISREERNRLIGCTEEGKAPRYGKPDRLFPNGVPEYNQRLIRRGRSKTRLLYFALVDASIIRAELRRHISQRIPGAEDSYTWSKEPYTDPLGKSGWYYELSNRRCFNYPTLAASASERYERLSQQRSNREDETAVLIPFPIPTKRSSPLDVPPTAA